jgi:hypothetical protein
MTVAVIDLATGTVENVIVATESDPAPEGKLFKEITHPWVVIGVKWDGSAFVEPPEPPKHEFAVAQTIKRFKLNML